MATVGAAAMFSAVCGSAVATATTIATVSVEEMRKYEYDEGLAAGSAAAGGTLGILIPPSSALVLYGALTEETIGGCLIAGIIPGIMTAILFMITIAIVLKFKPHLAPAVNRDNRTKLTWNILKYCWVIPVIFLFTIGGMLIGFFTPTEAGAMGALLALIISVLLRRLSWKSFLNAFGEMQRIMGMTFLILVGGNMFGIFLALSRVPMRLANFIRVADVSPYTVLVMIFIVYMFLGCLMDGMAIMVIMTPIIYPVIIMLGFNGVWFGILSILMLNIGLLSPPVGVVALVTASVTKVPPVKVFKGTIPFWFAMTVSCILITIFPQIALFLPNLMR